MVLNIINYVKNGYQNTLRHTARKKLSFRGAQRILNKQTAQAVVISIDSFLLSK